MIATRSQITLTSTMIAVRSAVPGTPITNANAGAITPAVMQPAATVFRNVARYFRRSFSIRLIRRAYSVFRSSCIVSCGSEVVGAFGGREDVDEAADGGPKALDGAFGGLAQECFQFGEGVLDGVEIGRVRREVEQACTRRLDQGSHACPLVARQVVQDHDVAWPQCRDEDLLNIGLEGRAVDRAVQHERRHHTARA